MRKKGKWKRKLRVLLALAVAVGIQMPVTVQAAATDRSGSVFAAVSDTGRAVPAAETLGESGTLGKNGGITWSYNAGTKTLTVSGKDELKGYVEQIGSIGYYRSPFTTICSEKEVDRIVLQDCKLSGSAFALFCGLSKVKEIDLSGLDTADVTDMMSMFSGCSALTSLNIKGLDTKNVTSMWAMFAVCKGLSSLDVRGLNTENVTGMGYMFYHCSGLKSLDVSSFNTKNVENMHYMFSNCSGLKSLDVSGFNTQNLQYTYYMFEGCTGLESLDVSTFNTAKVISMFSMFEGCTGLKSLDVSGFNTEEAKYIKDMFKGCSGLSSLDLGSFVIVRGADTLNMLQNCTPGVLKAPREIAEGIKINLSVPYYNEAGQKRTSLTDADGGHTLTKEKKQESAVTYRITYKLNGGTNHKKNPTTGKSTNKILLKEPSRTGYTFSGWYREIKGKDTKVTEIPKGNKEDVTLSARWKANTYTIKFNGNGATDGKMTKLTKRSYGKSYTLPANKFKRTGYTFTGWNTKKDGTGKTYKNKASVKNLTKKNGGEVTLYAQWKKNSSITYQIKFNGNGATGGKMSALTKCKSGKSYKLPANQFKKKGYTFVGWNTKKDGSGKTYKDKASVKDLTRKADKTVTLYAQWKKATKKK